MSWSTDQDYLITLNVLLPSPFLTPTGRSGNVIPLVIIPRSYGKGGPELRGRGGAG